MEISVPRRLRQDLHYQNIDATLRPMDDGYASRVLRMEPTLNVFGGKFKFFIKLSTQDTFMFSAPQKCRNLL